MVILAAFCLAATTQESWPQSLSASKDQSTVRISSAGKPLLEYRFADVPFKPYAAQLYSPAGVAVLRDSPHDHKHHHALMFALGADGVDFWSEKDTCGRQAHRSLDGPSASAAEFTHHLDWTAPDGKLILREDRTLRVLAGADVPATLLTWRSRLQTPPGKDSVALSGSHYFGLGARFVTTMDPVGEFVNPAGLPGDVVRGTERLVPAKWCAYAAPAGEQPVTFAIFDHPANARHPSRMFTMTKPFAYLSATLNLWKEPLRLKADQPLELCYGVALWDGKVSPAQIEQVYQRWLDLARNEAKR